MNPRKAKARRKRTDDQRLEMLKSGIDGELGQLHKTNALLIAAQFAANYECEFDVSDALAAIIVRVERHIETLDRLCLAADASA